MTLRLVYVGLSEVAVPDPRGNLNLLGFDQQLLVAPEFPATVAPYFICVVEDVADADNQVPSTAPSTAPSTVSMQMRVEDDSGSIIFLIEGPPTPSQPKAYEPAPSRAIATIQAPLTVSKPGRLRVVFNITVSSGVSGSRDQMVAQRDFWVDHPSALPSVSG
jgi:hypothetical protein